jgi:hypothetical protein
MDHTELVPAPGTLVPFRAVRQRKGKSPSNKVAESKSDQNLSNGTGAPSRKSLPASGTPVYSWEALGMSVQMCMRAHLGKVFVGCKAQCWRVPVGLYQGHPLAGILAAHDICSLPLLPLPDSLWESCAHYLCRPIQTVSSACCTNLYKGAAYATRACVIRCFCPG